MPVPRLVALRCRLGLRWRLRAFSGLPDLPKAFLETPLAHRGLHNDEVPENSLVAARAAIRHGYGVELDVQPDADGKAWVFHDAKLDRMTGCSGAIRTKHKAELEKCRLPDGSGIPMLADLLETVAGKVPLLLELKTEGLEQDTCARLNEYEGPVAVMSFNPKVIAKCRELALGISRGLGTYAFDDEAAEKLDPQIRDALRQIAYFDAVGASFVSHDHRDLGSEALIPLKARDIPVLCWTIRSAQDEAEARRIADNVTFEGYLAEIPA